MNGPISATRQRVLDDALHTLRTHGTNYYFALELLSYAQSFFKRIAVGFAHFKREVGLLYPGRLFINPQNRVLICDLLHHYDYFHRQYSDNIKQQSADSKQPEGNELRKSQSPDSFAESGCLLFAVC